MKAIINYFKKNDNLVAQSLWITSGVLLLIFIGAQLLTFTGLEYATEDRKPKMELRELIKLRFTPQPMREMPETIKPKVTKVTTRSARTASVRRKANDRQASSSFNFVRLVQGFDMKRLVTREARAARRGGSNRTRPLNAGISTDITRKGRSLDDFDLSGVIENTSSSFLAGRRSARGGSNGPKVGVGGTSRIGSGTGTGGTGLALSGRGLSRATRGGGTGNGGATITLPSGSGGGTGALDIHALIKWMKAHPGKIPHLVAYDMGHQSGDLSSAVSFRMKGKSYTLFLSCNEVELLLRICLVEGNDFTLLKDNGIKEESNFLTIGDVVRNNSKIQSLISSRKAPGDRAARFYQIFWSWWLQQPESRG